MYIMYNNTRTHLVSELKNNWYKMNAVIMIYVHVYTQYVNTGVCRIPCHWGATGCWMHDSKLPKRGWFDQESYLTVFALDPWDVHAPFTPPGKAWIRLWWRESQTTDSQPLEVVDHLGVHVCVVGGGHFRNPKCCATTGWHILGLYIKMQS